MRTSPMHRTRDDGEDDYRGELMWYLQRRLERGQRTLGPAGETSEKKSTYFRRKLTKRTALFSTENLKGLPRDVDSGLWHAHQTCSLKKRRGGASQFKRGKPRRSRLNQTCCRGPLLCHRAAHTKTSCPPRRRSHLLLKNKVHGLAWYWRGGECRSRRTATMT